ncbi:MAG TPA: hypothetical protein VFA33_23500 [Bryobacteraceae bacterium]|nr:hypothetical protein [Bryobacteraceae bacterium]
MPLPVPNLDDRNFDQLATEGRSLIPRYFPQWTDHNLSDPGITLLELFAFLTDAAFYQINRVPERSLAAFAGLVNVTRAPGEPVSATLARALEVIERQERAITADELEGFALSAVTGIARAKVVLQTSEVPTVFPAEQVVKLVLVPDFPNDPAPRPGAAMLEAVFQGVRSRCLIGTRLRATAPQYTPVSVDVTVVRDASSRLGKDGVAAAVTGAVTRFLSPLSGGEDGSGWVFGRSVFRSELDQVIERVDGVDHVSRLLLNGDEDIDELPLAETEDLRAVSLVTLARLTVAVMDL